MQVACNDAVAAVWSGVGVFVVTALGIGCPVPLKSTACGGIKFLCYLVVDNEVKVNNAIAAVRSLQFEFTVIYPRLIINKTEAMCIVNIGLSMPASAVVYGPVV